MGHRSILLVLVLALAGSALGCAAAGPERIAELRAMEAESAARLAAEGEMLYAADGVKLVAESYKAADGATRALEAGELRRGIREASKALYLGRVSSRPPLVAMAKRDLAYAYSMAGALDRAEQLASESIAEAQATRPESFQPATRGQVLGPAYKVRGDVLLRRGRLAEALADYERALAASEKPFQPFVRASLANAYLARGETARARQLFREADAAGSPALRPLVQRGLGEVALAERRFDEAARWFADAAAGAAGDDQAYHRLWALAGLARARERGGDRAGALAAYRQALAAADQVRAVFRSEEFKAGFFGDVQRVFDDAIRLHMAAGQAEAAFEVSERSRARALLDLLRGRVAASGGTQVFAGAGGPPATAAQVRAALPDGTALVEFHVLGDRIYAWRLRRSGMQAVALELGRDALVREASRLRAAIRSRAPEASALAAELHTRLVAPLGLARGEAVVFVPHDALHYVPLHALRGPAGWVIEERPVSYAPSASAAVHGLARSPGPRGQVLALGNPDLGSPRLALPGAQREVERLGALYPGAEVYVLRAATKERLVARAPQSEVVHVAAHAEVDEIDPLHSVIHLAASEKLAGELEAHEIYRLDLRRARLVTLSACDTGRGLVSRGDEIWGFTRAFLGAGAPALIASLWPVEDQATERLMGRFYTSLREGTGARDGAVREGPAPRAGVAREGQVGRDAAAPRGVTRDALRAAQLELLREPRTAHPFFWAPFVLVGDWR
jgi:CHAT domain-containing protein